MSGRVRRIAPVGAGAETTASGGAKPTVGSRRHTAILTRAARTLASSSRVETSLPRVARLVVPILADWCAIDLIGEDHTPRLVAIAHSDPPEEEALRERWAQYLTGISFPEGYAGTLRTQRALALPDIPERLAASGDGDPAYLAVLAELRARAALVVPLTVHGRLLGVLTLAATRPDRHLDHDDLALARQLAHLCALAVDNARRHAVAQAELAARRREVESLRDSDRFLQATLDALTAQTATLDATGTIVAVNAAWHRFAEENGYADPAHGVGRNYLAVCATATGVGAEGAADMARGIRAVLARERADFAFAYPCDAPARPRWFLARVTPITGGSPGRALIAHEEITAQHQAETALRASEEKYRGLVEQAAEGIILTDLAGTILEANAAALAMLGYRLEDLRGRFVGELIPAEEFAADPPHFAEALAGEIIQNTRWLRHHDGSLRYIAISSKRIGQGYFQAIWRDVTAQYAGEEALRTSEARFRTIFTQAMDAVLLADDAGRYLQANPAACALFGVPDEASLLGRWVGDFAPPTLQEAVRASWRQFLADGTQAGTFVLLRGDGTTRTVEYRATANLQPGQHLSILRDVTARDLAMAELADIQRQLVAARETERLSMARELHDTVVQQLLGISYQIAAVQHHERDGEGPIIKPDQGLVLGDVRREILATVRRLRGVIRDLRPAGLAEFGLTAALRGYLSDIQRERGDTLPRITVDLDHVDEQLPHALALCLFRVAQEALQNTIRHADAHHVAVTMRREAGEIRLRVHDDGRGFDVPERLIDYTDRGHFGLAGLVERVTLAGGDYRIESEPGIGTIVTVRLPLGPGGGDDGHGDPGTAGR